MFILDIFLLIFLTGFIWLQHIMETIFLFGVPWTSCIPRFISFSSLGKFVATLSLNEFWATLFFSSPSGIPIIWILVPSMVSQKSQKLSSLYLFLSPSLFLSDISKDLYSTLGILYSAWSGLCLILSTVFFDLNYWGLHF